jgi:hypothetical protein
MPQRWLSDAEIERMRRDGTIHEGLSSEQIARLRRNAERAGVGFRMATGRVPDAELSAAYSELERQGYDPPGVVQQPSSSDAVERANDALERAAEDIRLLGEAIVEGQLGIFRSGL